MYTEGANIAGRPNTYKLRPEFYYYHRRSQLSLHHHQATTGALCPIDLILRHKIAKISSTCRYMFASWLLDGLCLPSAASSAVRGNMPNFADTVAELHIIVQLTEPTGTLSLIMIYLLFNMPYLAVSSFGD